MSDLEAHIEQVIREELDDRKRYEAAIRYLLKRQQKTDEFVRRMLEGADAEWKQEYEALHKP
jgi:hypothetical protein